ncbi:glutamyl aminopeptidase-like [Tachypleus tridentatus]|uniref:glutamyl aminopeptidase-like n=1 Tax=Tachypleus tridentatus TaxID=6853 RepID=UPI003FD37E8A
MTILLSEQLDVALDDGLEGWFKFNVNQIGFYVINYEENDWQKITDLLKKNHEVWSPSNRANVIRDSFFLARAGYLKYSVSLELSTYLKDERHLVPWETANMVLSYISRPLENSESKFLLKKYIKPSTADVVAELGWSDENDDHLGKRTRVTVLNLACGVEYEECLNNVTELLRQWKDGKKFEKYCISVWDKSQQF